MLDIEEIPLETLHGEKVCLRKIGEADVPVLFQLIVESRDFLAAHLPWPADVISEEDVQARLESWELQAEMGSGGCWGIFHEGCITGCIILGWVQKEHHSATISYWLGKPFTGMGFATDALKTMSQFVFETLKLNRLEISVSVNNLPSAAVARRVGFQEEGICRQYERINGNFEDHIRFSLLASDYQNRS